MQQAVADFVFDLNDCTRRSLSASEVAPLYDVRLRELTEKYFTTTGWPDAATVAPECGGDEDFLLLYREMVVRARSMVSGSFKFQAQDFLDSWSNYTRLFAFVNADPVLVLTPQWIYDIIQEYVYQFQGFCQYRAAVRNERETALLQASPDAWAVGAVHGTLGRLISNGKLAPTGSAVQVFGYFAMIELSRLECLLGDFSASVQAISAIRIFDKTELFCSVLTSHVNIFYHVAVSLLMLRQYGDAIAVLSDALLHIARILRPGAASLRSSAQSLLTKMSDKMLSLVALAMALSPGHRVDDQLRELVEAKVLDKFRRLQMGDLAAFEDAFESACPKFVSPSLPADYQGGNPCQETVRMVVAVFLQEAQAHAALLRLRSYLRMYSRIELSKLARFNESSEAQFVSQLVAYKQRNAQTSLTTSAKEHLNADAGAFSSADIHYFVEGGALVIEELTGASDRSRAAERFFVAGIRKHAEIALDLKRNCKKYGL